MAGTSVRHRQGGAGDAQAVATALHPVRLLERVGDTGQREDDTAAHLVAEREIARQRAVDVLHLAAPDMEVGAAHPGARQPDQDGAGLGVGYRVLAQLEITAVGLEHRHSSRHGRTSSCPGRIGRGLSLVQRGRVAHFILSRSSTMAWSKASTRIKPWRGYSSSRMTYTETAIAPAKPSAWAQLSVLALAMP